MSLVSSDAEPSFRAEIFRAVRVCAPSADRLGTLTYEAVPADEARREMWCGSVLARHLQPAVFRAHAAAAGNGVRELLGIDAALGAGLVGPAGTRSLAAGRALSAGFHPPASARTLSRYVAALEGEPTGGHLATLLAARAATFNIPPQMALAALVFLEMRAAPTEIFWACVEACLASAPSREGILAAD